MLIGLNALKTVSRKKSPVLDAWFHAEEGHETQPTQLADETVERTKDLFNQVQIHRSLRNIQTDSGTSIPAMPRLGESVNVPVMPLSDRSAKAPAMPVSEADSKVAVLPRSDRNAAVAQLPVSGRNTKMTAIALAESGTSVPALPEKVTAWERRPAEKITAEHQKIELGPAETQAPPRSPYQVLSEILDADSPSSRWLDTAGMLQKFMSTDCFVDMTMTSDGGVSSVLRSPDGYRRTVVCRIDGSTSQRITGPRGEEIVRFLNSSEAVVAADKRDNDLVR